MTYQPFVSVVVPARNSVHDVGAFVTSLRQQSYPAERFEVIIVDNGSSDGTLEAIQRSGVIALQRKETGRARALNTGVLHARGEIICTTDISCRAAPDWIEAVVKGFEAPDVVCVAGEIELLKTHVNRVVRFQERTSYMSPMLALNRRSLPFMPYGDGANSSFRRALFEEVGLFEESFIKAADVEICYRIYVLTKYKILFDCNAVVREPGEPDLRALLGQRFRIGIGQNLLRMKYPQLYARRSRVVAPRRLYWSAREGLQNVGGLLLRNAKAIRGADESEAATGNIRFLMRAAQRCGRAYGRWYLKRHGIRPDPVDGDKLAAFLASYDGLADRVAIAPARHSAAGRASGRAQSADQLAREH